MKIKLENIVRDEKNLQALQHVEMPAKVSYRIKRLNDKITPILKSYNEKRVELIKKHGEEQIVEGKPTDIFQVLPEKEKEFYKELQEVLDIEEKIDFEPIKIEEIGNIVVSPNKLVEWIFE
jgi:hypothetical protein